MKLFAFFILLLLALVGSKETTEQHRHIVNLHPKARKISENVYSLGVQDWKGRRNVQTIAMIHTAKGPKDHGLNSESQEFSHLSCCASIENSGARWRSSESYLVDPTNPFGMSNQFVMDSIANAANSWDSQVTFGIYGSIVQQTFGSTPTVNVPDGQNVKFFAALGDLPLGIENPSSVIAVTILHGVFGGSPSTNEILEADIVFNTLFPYGDATSNSGVMDLESIATHEEGHLCGLGHPSTSLSCFLVTMYPTAVLGETHKRTLAPDDIACIRSLYSEPGSIPPPPNEFTGSASKLSLGMSTLVLFILSLI